MNDAAVLQVIVGGAKDRCLFKEQYQYFRHDPNECLNVQQRVVVSIAFVLGNNVTSSVSVS